MRKVLLLLVALAFVAGDATAAQKQTRKPKRAAPPARVEKQQPPPPPPEVAPPYEAEMARLTEILGAVNYLESLCNGPEGTAWREDMEALLRSESPGPQRRARLIASFNRGYRSVSETHHQCTPAARLLIDRYMGEGAKLSRDIASRYGV